MPKLLSITDGDAQPNRQDDGNQIHPGVMCDGCEGSIRGLRYKCLVCPDFDLCKICEGKGMHIQHDMMKITTPGGLPGFPGFPFGQQGPHGSQGVSEIPLCIMDVFMLLRSSADFLKIQIKKKKKEERKQSFNTIRMLLGLDPRIKTHALTGLISKCSKCLQRFSPDKNKLS